ncbi:MAG: sel1 repeat family protein [Opitutae bacterium]|nr:sel1 repeat family protein [Opitutae bacterium]
MKIKYSVFWAVAAVFLGGACLPVYADDEIKSEEPVSEESLESLEKAAEAGDVEAQERLIKIYGNGEEGIPRDDTKVFYWSGKAAEHGSAKGFYGLAMCYLFGRGGVEQDSQKFLYYAEKSASLGYVHANTALGGMYGLGYKGIKADMGKALMYLKVAADGGDPEGMSSYGVLLLRVPPVAGESVEGNKILGEKYIYEAALRGEPQAQYNLAVLYDNGGFWIKKDQKKKMEWLAKSARQNNQSAICLFCRCILENYRIPLDKIELGDFAQYATPQEIFSWVKNIAENRVSPAIYDSSLVRLSETDVNLILSEFYRQGFGVEKDITLAEKYLGKAVDNSRSSLVAPFLAISDFSEDPDYPGDKIRRSAERQIALSVPETDYDVAQRDALSKLLVQLHRKRLSRGESCSDIEDPIFAQVSQANVTSPARSFFLGLCYENGYGVVADREKAIEYYLQGAEKNDPLSMRNLGKLYFEIGDTESALKWYNKAAELGDNVSKEILEKFPLQPEKSTAK